MKRLYHKLMHKYYSWRLRRYVAYIRKIGRIHNLPSLDAYPDKAVVEGFRQFYLRQKSGM